MRLLPAQGCGSQKEYKEKRSGYEQAHGKAEQYAIQPHAGWKTEDICGRDSYHDITYERNPKHRKHMRSAAQGVGECYLCGISQLVQHEREYECGCR